MTDFETTTEAWLKEQDYIGENHPLVFSVLEAARQLDKKSTIAMYKEYNSLIKHIESKKPVGEVEDEEEDDLLAPENFKFKSYGI